MAVGGSTRAAWGLIGCVPCPDVQGVASNQSTCDSSQNRTQTTLWEDRVLKMRTCFFFFLLQLTIKGTIYEQY